MPRSAVCYVITPKNMECVTQYTHRHMHHACRAPIQLIGGVLTRCIQGLPKRDPLKRILRRFDITPKRDPLLEALKEGECSRHKESAAFAKHTSPFLFWEGGACLVCFLFLNSIDFCKLLRFYCNLFAIIFFYQHLFRNVYIWDQFWTRTVPVEIALDLTGMSVNSSETNFLDCGTVPNVVWVKVCSFYSCDVLSLCLCWEGSKKYKWYS